MVNGSTEQRPEEKQMVRMLTYGDVPKSQVGLREGESRGPLTDKQREKYRSFYHRSKALGEA